MLLATATFDDEDPDLHVHFTAHVRALEVEDPVEFLRVLRIFEEACSAYAVRLARARERVERAQLEAAEDRAARA
jgi:hypothetical protein